MKQSIFGEFSCVNLLSLVSFFSSYTEVTQSTVFPSHLDSAVQLTSEVSRHGPTEQPDGEMMARYTGQELGIEQAEEEIQLVVLDPNHVRKLYKDYGANNYKMDIKCHKIYLS